MRALRVFMVVSFVTLMALASIGSVSATSNILPSESSVKLYVETLVSQYTQLVSARYSPYTGYPNFRVYFPLYEPPNTSFEVLVMQCVPNETGYVALVFNPIVSVNGPNIVMDYNDTFQQLVNPNVETGLTVFTFTNVTVNYNGVPNIYSFVEGLPIGNITSNTVANAYAQAGSLYVYHASHVPYSGITTAQTTTTTTKNSTPVNTTTTEVPPKHIFGIAVNDPQNWWFVSVFDFLLCASYVLVSLIRPNLLKRYRSESDKHLIDIVIDVVIIVFLGGLAVSFPYDFQVSGLQMVAIVGTFPVVFLFHRFVRPHLFHRFPRTPTYKPMPKTGAESKEENKKGVGKKEAKDSQIKDRKGDRDLQPTPIIAPRVVTRTSDYVATLNDSIIQVDATLRPVSIILPPATNEGKQYEIYPVKGVNPVTIQPSGNDRIRNPVSGDMPNALLTLRDSIKLTADGIDGWIVGPGFFLTH